MRMQAPKGTDSCSFDGRTYEADAKGFVDVPDRAAIALMSHGFAVAGKVTDPDAADELKALEVKNAKTKRLKDAQSAQMLARGSVDAAKTKGDAEALNEALSKLAVANAELEAATAAVGAQ